MGNKSKIAWGQSGIAREMAETQSRLLQSAKGQKRILPFSGLFCPKALE